MNIPIVKTPKDHTKSNANSVLEHRNYKGMNFVIITISTSVPWVISWILSWTHSAVCPTWAPSSTLTWHLWTILIPLIKLIFLRVKEISIGLEIVQMTQVIRRKLINKIKESKRSKIKAKGKIERNRKELKETA